MSPTLEVGSLQGQGSALCRTAAGKARLREDIAGGLEALQRVAGGTLAREKHAPPARERRVVLLARL
jgi:hypothetical protein